MARLSQETIAIIGVGVTFLGVGIAVIALGLSVAESLREEMRADRAEAHAGRERFERQILRLTKGQGVLFGLIEGRSQDGGEAGDAADGAPPAER